MKRAFENESCSSWNEILLFSGNEFLSYVEKPVNNQLLLLPEVNCC